MLVWSLIMKKVIWKLILNNSLNENSSDEINFPQLIKSFDEKQTVLKESVFLSPPTIGDCVPDPATAIVSFLSDEADSIYMNYTCSYS